MNKTKIEWADYTINPVKGLCPVACDYCYARAMYKRFKWNPEIRWEYGWAYDLTKIKQPSRIFVGSTIELFGDWIKPEWLKSIFMHAQAYPYHTFIFLTKQPQNLIKFSPFPDNCWVGVSATDSLMAWNGYADLAEIKASAKFISFEPLLAEIDARMIASFKGVIDWVIIGSQTKPYKPPKIEWVQEIVQACDKAGIPVFLKNNLKPLLKNAEGWTPAWAVSAREPDGSKEYLRQEMPKKEK